MNLTLSNPGAHLAKHGTHLTNLLILMVACVLPDVAMAASPFATGTSAFSPALLTILTPFAAIAFMATGVGALTGKISWMWFAGCIVGIVLIFGANQLVTWIRSLFGV